MNVSSIGPSAAVSGGYGAKQRPDPLSSMLKGALSSGKITQTQYDDTVKELSALKEQTQSSSGVPPTREEMDSFRQKADAILKKVGLEMPEPPSRGKLPDSDNGQVSGATGTSNDWVQVLLNLLKTKTSDTSTESSTANTASAFQGGAINLLA